MSNKLERTRHNGSLADDIELATFINKLKEKYEVFASGDIQSEDNTCYKVLFTNNNGTNIYFILHVYSTLWAVWYKLDGNIQSFGRKGLTLDQFFDRVIWEINLPLKKKSK